MVSQAHWASRLLIWLNPRQSEAWTIDARFIHLSKTLFARITSAAHAQ